MGGNENTGRYPPVPRTCPFCGADLDPTMIGYTPTSAVDLPFSRFTCPECEHGGLLVHALAGSPELAEACPECGGQLVNLEPDEYHCMECSGWFDGDRNPREADDE